MGSVRVNYKFYNNFSKFLKSEQLKHLNGVKKVTRKVLQKIETAKLSDKDIGIIVGFKHQPATIRLFRNPNISIRKKYKILIKKKYYLKEYKREYKRDSYSYRRRGYITQKFFDQLGKFENKELCKKAFGNIFKKLQKRYSTENVLEGVYVIESYLCHFDMGDYFYNLPLYKYALLNYGLKARFNAYSFFSDNLKYKASLTFVNSLGKKEAQNCILEFVKLDETFLNKILDRLPECSDYLAKNRNDNEEKVKAAKTMLLLLQNILPKLLNKIKMNSIKMSTPKLIFTKLLKLKFYYPERITDKYLIEFLLNSQLPKEAPGYDEPYYKLLKLFQKNIKQPKRNNKKFTTNQCKICGSELKENEKFLCSKCSNI